MVSELSLLVCSDPFGSQTLHWASRYCFSAPDVFFAMGEDWQIWVDSWRCHSFQHRLRLPPAHHSTDFVVLIFRGQARGQFWNMVWTSSTWSSTFSLFNRWLRNYLMDFHQLVTKIVGHLVSVITSSYGFVRFFWGAINGRNVIIYCGRKNDFCNFD